MSREGKEYLEKVGSQAVQALQGMESDLETRKSKATKIRSLLQVHQGFLKRKKSLANFREPALILMRNNMKDEFYEEVTQGRFYFDHSNGRKRYIIIDPSRMRSLPYGDKVLHYYVCHEDYPYPLPDSPVMSAEKFQSGIDQTLNIKQDWEAQLKGASAKFWWSILLGIALIAGVLILGKLLVGDLGFGDFFSGLFGGGGGEAVAEVPPDVTVIP